MAVDLRDELFSQWHHVWKCRPHHGVKVDRLPWIVLQNPPISSGYKLLGAESCSPSGNLPLTVSIGFTGCYGGDPSTWSKGKGDVTHAGHRFFSHFQTHTHTHTGTCARACAHTHTHSLDAQKKNLGMFFRFLQEAHGSHKL